MARHPGHSIRVEEALWTKAVELAAERGDSVSEVCRRALERYVANPPKKPVRARATNGRKRT